MKKRILIVGDDEAQKKLIGQAIATSKCNDGVIIVDEREEKPMKGAGYFALANAVAGGGWPLLKVKPKERIKQCLECGDDYRGNNCWCSAECCKTYRFKRLLEKEKL